LQLVASQRGSTDAIKNAAVHASVHIGEPEGSKGFGLAVDLHVEGVEDQALIDASHAACPYSRALKDGAVVNVRKGSGDPATGAQGSTASADKFGEQKNDSSDSSDNSKSAPSSWTDKSGGNESDGLKQSGSRTAGYQ
jgi:hypothetical protein